MRLCVILLGLLFLVGTARGAETFDSEESALLVLINGHRQSHGVPPLVFNDQLMAAAEWMSNDMATKDYISHTDSLGRNQYRRIADFGYGGHTWKDENLIAGADTAQRAFRLFKGSPWHNANMLNANFQVIGIACTYNEASTYGWYWTTDFGGQATVMPTSTSVPTPTSTPVPSPTAPPIPIELPKTGTAPHR